MISKISDSLNHLETELKNIEEITPELLTRYEKSIQSAKLHFREIKYLLSNGSFKTLSEEIQYFKNIQPVVISKIIYYAALYKHESKMQNLCTLKAKKSLCKQELKNIQSYFSDNQYIITYYKSDKCVLDERYFIRNNSDFPFILEECFAMVEKEFSTGYDLIIARFLAYERFSDYIKVELHWLSSDLPIPQMPPTWGLNFPLKWTGSKAELVELLYALVSEGCINDNQCEIIDLAKQFEKIFNVEFGDIYHTFSEIKNRKNQTLFIDNLKKALLRKMEEKEF